MLHKFNAKILLGIVLLALLTIRTTQAAGPTTRTLDLNPFTHAAFIPADADLSSIRFAGQK